MSALDLVESRYVGIVNGVVDVLAAPDDARLFQRIAIVSAAARLSGERLSVVAGGGYSAEAEHARRAAVGEAVERYSATAYVPDEELVLATASELGDQAIAPERFALFASEQHARQGFRFEPFTGETRVRWVLGRRLTDSAPVYLPAQLVYLPRPRPELGEAEIGYATSNGLACGSTYEEALLAGLLELLERDAFMITWASRLTLPRLDATTDATLDAFVCARLAPTGLRLEAVDLSRFHDVPAVLAVVHADGRAPGELGVGAAAAPTITQAWRKAVAEAFAVRSAARGLLALRPERAFADDCSDVETFEDHIHLYGLRKHVPAAAFLDSSAELRSLSSVAPLEGNSPEEHIEALLRRLAARQLEAFAVDVTAPDVREAGLHVVRAVVPELCPLDVRHDARFLGGTRLRRAAYELGLAPEPLSFEALNPDPHPFP